MAPRVTAPPVAPARSVPPASSPAAGSLPPPETLWQAVLARDAAFDGRFVYGVRSTGVYCRPTCPARRPRRDRVVFFTDPAPAEAAGFRACLRCRPAAEPAAASLVRQVQAHVQAHLDEPLTLAALAAATGASPSHVQRTFRRQTGITPFRYAEAARLDRARAALRSGTPVADAAYAAGYGSASRLYERAPGHLGMSPAAYGRGGRGAAILYTLAAAPLGMLLVAATARGICRVSVGDSAGQLEADLAREFPAADRRRDDERLGEWVRAVLDRVAGGAPKGGPSLPLDVRATSFQRRVWEALQAIPRGETRTYGQVAAAIGRPRAVRAVGRACGANPVAVLVPCHRVVPAGGGLGGYRWGPERKAALLAAEAAAPGPAPGPSRPAPPALGSPPPEARS